MKQATKEDVPKLVKMIAKFNSNYWFVPVNLDKASNLVSSCIENENGVVYITNGGFIAGVITDDQVRNWKILVELGWYAEDFTGIRLLKQFEKFGEQRGVNEIRMTTLTSYPKAQELLSRVGYKAVEISHSKIL